MAALSLSDVTVRRGPTTVVEALTLTVRPGSVFWIVGPNGAGKSSLLRVMAGLDMPDRGAVRREPGPFRYLHPEMSLPSWSTVGAWERLTRGLDPGLRPPTPLRPPIDGRRRVRRLSTGERKRLLLDTLLRVPGSLLLDEPFAHLSPGAGATLSRLLRARAGRAVVVVATNRSGYRAAADSVLHLGTA